MLNVVAIMGRLVADPELRTTPQGTNVCSLDVYKRQVVLLVQHLDHGLGVIVQAL